MHAVTTLAGHQGKREFLRRCGNTLSRLEIGRMPQAVVIVVAGNLRGEELNLSGFGRERMSLRICPEIGKRHIIPVLFSHREEEIPLLPEGIKVRHLLTQIRSHLARVVIELADPIHLGAPFRVGLLNAKLVSER